MKALRATGKLIKAAISENIPERPDLPSGTALPPGTLKNEIYMGVHIAKDGFDSNRVRVGPEEDVQHIAIMVENGHAIVKGGYSKKTDKGRRGPGRVIGQVEAKGYYRKAADGVEAQAVNTYEAVMTEEIAKVMNGQSD